MYEIGINVNGNISTYVVENLPVILRHSPTIAIEIKDEKTKLKEVATKIREISRGSKFGFVLLSEHGGCYLINRDGD